MVATSSITGTAADVALPAEARPDYWLRLGMNESQIQHYLLFGEDGSDRPLVAFSRGGLIVADFVRMGLPASAFLRIQAMFLLPVRSMAGVLGITPSTLRRRLDRDMLKPPEADRLARLARILAHALRVFEDPARVRQWLEGHVPALEDRTPLELLGTDAGATEVDAALTRLEHGVIG